MTAARNFPPTSHAAAWPGSGPEAIAEERCRDFLGSPARVALLATEELARDGGPRSNVWGRQVGAETLGTGIGGEDVPPDEDKAK